MEYKNEEFENNENEIEDATDTVDNEQVSAQIVKEVNEIVEKGGISRIASNLEEKIKEFGIKEKENNEIEKKLQETKKRSEEKESEIASKSKTLSIELNKFIKKANIIKQKNIEFEEKTREIKLKAIDNEKRNVEELHLLKNKIERNSLIDEKISKLSSMNKEIANLINVDKLITNDKELLEQNGKHFSNVSDDEKTFEGLNDKDNNDDSNDGWE